MSIPPLAWSCSTKTVFNVDADGKYPSLHNGRYTINHQIGKGTYAVVMQAVDQERDVDSPDRVVAIKINIKESRYVHRAKKELKILHSLQGHPGIVRIIDDFEHDGFVCIVMELLTRTLELSSTLDRLMWRDADHLGEMTRQFVNVLQHLNKHKVVHADLTTVNVMIVMSPGSSSLADTNAINNVEGGKEDSSLLVSPESTESTESTESSPTRIRHCFKPPPFQIKVIDFGLSEQNNDEIQVVKVAAQYRAPEIWLGNPFDASIDVWSFGCIMYQLATGDRLMYMTDEDAIFKEMMRLCAAGNTRFNKLFIDQNSKTHLGDLLCRCMEWDPVDRITPDEIAQHAFVKPL